MEMKKAACAILFAAASISTVMADVAAPAPAPTATGDASASLSVVGSIVGASAVSLIAYFLQ
ncbi:arabinogalactan peptide 23-like [Durio zibethinus]|uniref:Arabinogalactan peptide 23-like n=1 Tax=Durio zibethinus TaxID=66656 RepID=A0A6P5Y2M5_DURZI|nr:arabinogalactan peptide 23-like [Durio zibethinus]